MWFYRETWRKEISPICSLAALTNRNFSSFFNILGFDREASWIFTLKRKMKRKGRSSSTSAAAVITVTAVVAVCFLVSNVSCGKVSGQFSITFFPPANSQLAWIKFNAFKLHLMKDGTCKKREMNHFLPMRWFSLGLLLSRSEKRCLDYRFFLVSFVEWNW